MKINQKGFTVVEGLLLTVIVVIIAAIAWYVFHVNIQAGDNLGDLGKIEKKDSTQASTNQQTSTSSPSTPAKTVSSKPKIVTTTPKPVNNYITIDDWKVKFKKNGTITIMYAHDSNDKNHRAAFFSSTELASRNKACKAVFYPAGYIVRYKSDEHYYDEKGADTGKTTKEYYDSQSKGSLGSGSSVKQIGDYYYFYRGPVSKCSELKAIQDLQDKTTAAVRAFFDSLQSASS